MSNDQMLARPYAKAAFEHAVAHHQLKAWLDFLQRGAQYLSDIRLVQYLKYPQTTHAQIYQCLSQLLKPVLFKNAENFLKLLIQNKRWVLLGSIAQLFKQLQFAKEGKLNVQVISAVKLTQTEIKTIKQQLTQRLNKKLIIENTVDPSLLGGVMIRIDDLVIDHSVRNNLTKLRASLTHLLVAGHAVGG
jgi:F-type H+-transporting ATPase subunit delta